jgi:pimeloyl-ACP methyl ester carboxylesterase
MERIHKFRSDHPYKYISDAGFQWEYISCGNGAETLLLLIGGLRIAEAAHRYIELFENTYRVITPTYPPAQTMDELVDGITTILDAEQISQAIVLGHSYGGAIAQVLIQRHPSRVNRLILSGTLPLTKTWEKCFLSSLLIALARILPNRIVMTIFKGIVSPLVTVKETEQKFWDKYIDELIRQRLTKDDVLSTLLTFQHAQKKYACANGMDINWGRDVLAIWGENDPLNSRRSQEGILRIYPKVQIHEIRGGGHTAAMSNPREYTATVNGFDYAR